MSKILYVALFIFCAYVVYEVVRFVTLVQRGAAEVSVSDAYTQEGVSDGIHVLVLGDSTAVGTGADNPRNSVAGRIGREHPDASIDNRGVNGARLRDIAEQISSEPLRDSYDMILLQVGGNDILRFSRYSDIEAELMTVLEQLNARSNRVVLMSTGNVGSAPAFGPIAGYIYSKRTQHTRNIFMSVAERASITYVDLYFEPADDPFAREPETYHASDGLHPSGAGYGIWYAVLQDTLARAQKTL